MAVASGLENFVAPGSDRAGLSRGARVGLVSHPASVDRSLRHAVDLVASHEDLELTRLFAPEHGLRGEAQDMEPVGAAVDARTGLGVVSLYGDRAESLRPRAADLADLDGIVYDLQDVGSRYYTFVYTLSYVMEAARDAGIPVVVLDRPNPIGGACTEGPVLDPSMSSFVGRYPLPVRHGLTTGELARLFNEHFAIGGDLRVVAMTGWRREMHHDDTGLPWVAPSPNMPTPVTAEVYPGGCLVEGTNLSEGRGTTRPFELVGSPGLDGHKLAAALSDLALPGALFRPVSFRPMFQKHAGEVCEGVQIHIGDRSTFRPFATYLSLIREARALAPDAFDWRREPYEFETERLAIDLLLGRADLRALLEAGAGLDDLENAWREDLDEFDEIRRRFFLYTG
ncbi:MAG: DUF1343 domain-containing protein [Acidobacteriota bacterium]|nr:DUF1343 domain-containing protein [Acidobacteriota bacterium]